MTILRNFPQAVRELEHIWVPMPDGCRLAGRVWMPEDAAENPVPAVLEYIPYRKGDLTAERDASMHPYVAAHGYAVVRLDLRGAGDSEGLMPGEYLEQELQDGFDAVQWISEQPWCDGKVGMIGISWGGFNGLQVAAMQPPALKAVITCCSTDDRYADDVHYMGGCLLIDNLSWASIMFGRNTLPPDPEVQGDAWRENWRLRLEKSGLWLKDWLEHQTRDDFWKHGSICEDYAQVQVPVYAVSGWADGYCRSVFRLVEKLPGPRKGLVGPWAHTYPHIGQPGPAIGFLQECLRWWDEHLKGRDTGIMEEPMLRLFMQDGAEPKSQYDTREGRWVAEPSWPSPNVSRIGFSLSDGGKLERGAGSTQARAASIRSPLGVGVTGGKWCSYALPGDQPVDQRADDAGSLLYETEPLSEAIEIAGDACLDLAVSADRPVAMVAVRLMDVAPDGKATRVTYGLMNLTHRNSHEKPEALVPGEIYRLRVPFKHVAQRFEKGHRIRLGISSSYFPLAWPSPELTTLTVHPAETNLELPLREGREGDAELRDFAPVEQAPPLAIEELEQPEISWRVTQDHGTGETILKVADGSGRIRIPGRDLTIANQGYEIYKLRGDDPTSVVGEVRWDHEVRRGNWSVRSRTETVLWCDAESFHIEARLTAWEGDDVAWDQTWKETLPRKLL